jgi:hypothetical protein
MNMRKTYTVYCDSLWSIKCGKELFKIRKWEGPIFSNNIRSIMLYSKEDAEKFVEVLKEHNVDIYRKKNTGPYKFEFVKVE